MRLQSLAIAFALYCLNAFAVLQPGDTVPYSCWQNASGNNLCWNETVDVVRVFMYNAGYCGPCNEEMAALIPRVKEYDGKPVLFLSLSIADYNGSRPTPEFLKSWQQKYNIPFPVLAAPRSELAQYDDQPGIPMDIIVDQNGKMSAMVEGYDNGGIDVLFGKINALLKGKADEAPFIKLFPFSSLP